MRLKVCSAMCGNAPIDRKSTRLNSSHTVISYAAFCLKKKSTRLNSSHTVISYAVFCLKNKREAAVRNRQNYQPHLRVSGSVTRSLECAQLAADGRWVL